jgi:hypothetical protein
MLQQTYDSSAAFRFEVPDPSLPRVTQEHQIGDTGFDRDDAGFPKRWSLRGDWIFKSRGRLNCPAGARASSNPYFPGTRCIFIFPMRSRRDLNRMLFRSASGENAR